MQAGEASALAGLGQASVPELIAAEAVSSGQLAVLAGPEPAARGYWLVAPWRQWRQKKMLALEAFLTS